MLAGDGDAAGEDGSGPESLPSAPSDGCLYPEKDASRRPSLHSEEEPDRQRISIPTFLPRRPQPKNKAQDV